GEPVANTARVLSRQCAAIVWRTDDHARVEEMAAASAVPVVNALTDRYHPCQLLADLQTIRERKGRLAGHTLVYAGDGANNMAHSYLVAGALAGMHVRIGAPRQFAPNDDVLRRAASIAATTGGSVAHITDPGAVFTDADVIATDTWLSMGQEGESSDREVSFRPFAVDEAAVE